MNFKALLAFIVLEDGRLKTRHENYPDHEKRILARAVKLSEEVGELADAVLGFNAMQRADKAKKDKSNLSDEFADVIITTLLLALAMKVDIQKALEKKIEKINARYQKS